LKNSPLLQAFDISKDFDYTLFENINFNLWSQQSVAIMGRSGSGKSTLLHILSTLLKPDKGKVHLFGEDIYSMKESDIERIRRERIGIIFQSHYLLRA